jgi:hypothetical protein
MLPTKFQFIWESGFRGDFLEINQLKTRMAYGGHVCKRIELNEQFFQRTSHRCLLRNFSSFVKAVSEEIFLEIN